MRAILILLYLQKSASSRPILKYLKVVPRIFYHPHRAKTFLLKKHNRWQIHIDERNISWYDKNTMIKKGYISETHGTSDIG